jgi:regulator of protease activity HflC (stomatin/prohibitin superfamily)
MAVPIFLGKILDEEWRSGPHFALWPLFYVRRETKNSIQVHFGTVDENTRERADMSDDSDSWYVMIEPVRINWGDIKSSGLPEADQKIYANDPYANTITTDPHIYFIIRICNLKNLIERVGGLQEAIERIKDTCVGALTEMAGQTFVAEARKKMDELSLRIREKVEDLVGDPESIKRGKSKPVDSWGINVEEVRIKDIGAPHDANKALALRAATIAEADGKATATIRLAISTHQQLKEEGEGKAEAIKAIAGAEQERLTKEGEGRAAALKAVAEAADTSAGKLVIQTDTLRAVMTANGGKIVVVPTDLSGLTGAVTAIVEAVKQAPSK